MVLVINTKTSTRIKICFNNSIFILLAISLLGMDREEEKQTTQCKESASYSDATHVIVPS